MAPEREIQRQREKRDCSVVVISAGLMGGHMSG
jgi:hypothetical protein